MNTQEQKKEGEKQATERSQMLKEIHTFVEYLAEKYVTETKRRAILLIAIDREVEDTDSIPSTCAIVGDMNTLGPGFSQLLDSDKHLMNITRKAMTTFALEKMIINSLNAN